MKLIIFFLLGCIITLGIVGVILHKAGMIDYIVDSVFSDENEIVSEDFCRNHGHTLQDRTIDGKTIKVCSFKYGGWCEIGDFYTGSCGDA